MALATMGVRAALRTVQDSSGTPDHRPTVVVDTIAYDQADGDAAPEGTLKKQVGGSAKFLESLEAWIPAEVIALFVFGTGFANVLTNAWYYEFTLLAACILITVVYAYLSVTEAHKRRSIGDKAKMKNKPVTTVFIAVVAFIVWWSATPGTWLTTDMGVPTFFPSIVLAVSVLLIPKIAEKLGVEPAK
ncbi:hypothetical protein [Rhodococcus sovatensis]|uniref:Uncharacterized protein n=1 Tax=Rhodococcus sovatensis TaxID=1805840 RepID=A0ABZ2PF02_9NOCA